MQAHGMSLHVGARRLQAGSVLAKAEDPACAHAVSITQHQAGGMHTAMLLLL
jgi:hypothetical protein